MSLETVQNDAPGAEVSQLLDRVGVVHGHVLGPKKTVLRFSVSPNILTKTPEKQLKVPEMME